MAASPTAPADCDGLRLTVQGAGATDVNAVARAIPAACATMAARGLALQAAPDVVVHESVDSFVDATGQTVDTLRAWSTPAAVHLLTLASWRRIDDDAVVRRLTHELCHVALFQRLGEGARRVPRSLGEGLCSVVAGQGPERMPVDEVQRRLANGDVVDFVGDSPLAYGVAHHVVAGIAACRGDAAVLVLVDAVAAGATVADALGAPPLTFLDGCGADDEAPGTSGPEGVESRR